MAFTINGEIKTKLHYKDVVLISIAVKTHLDKYGERMDEEQRERMNNLVNRLGSEVYNYKEIEPNGH